MSTYLERNPPRRRQYRFPRRARPSGVIVVHTAESTPDWVGHDSGAENVAAFIQTRSTPGSYHDLVDSDSIVHLVPYDAEAYGDGTGSNPHAYHVSAATQAAKWNRAPARWRDATVRNMARASARYARWLEKNHGILIPARRITRAQSEARMPGFISHGERDPGRRTDPGKDFPWDDFLAYYAAEMNLTTQEDQMTPDQEKKLDRALSLLDRLPADVWRYTNPDVTDRQAYSHLLGADRRATEAAVDAAANRAAVGALASSQGLDPARIEANVTAAVKAALEGLSITLTTEES